ncbi:MAG: bifunctional phosphopantothenoylcysteine decarboxylase/phosphopantothenate--cysteine ligase CoaBC [Clostridiales bacterium]|nr:bifunctional phosphopantothenoylcysteine decarboxylase/phosphopantothenate--cysteine ligase CoaBC [Clostridiales bacterium]
MDGLGTVVLGVTGGIAAYKSCEVVSRLVKAGVGVYVIMTRSACEFVSPLTFQTLSRNPVAVDTFEAPNAWEVEHISLAKKADVLLVAPATANVLAKLANGLADDMLTTTALACDAPLLLAPAMNTVMWQHPATQQNLQTLLARGARSVGPEGGSLACGDVGAGRMSEPQDIVDACLSLLAARRDMEGLRVLVTAGPTREALDPVRFLTNRSSGKMGYAIARAAVARGAQVTLVTGPVHLPAVAGAGMVPVTTTADLLREVTLRAPGQDVLIQAAAPADFAPALASERKLKKNGDGGLTLELVQTADVAREAGRSKKPGQTFVGFAAETHDGLENARRKLESKFLDLIALNDVTRPGAGFDTDTNELTLLTRDTVKELPMMSKQEAAEALLDEILRLRGKAPDA